MNIKFLVPVGNSYQLCLQKKNRHSLRIQKVLLLSSQLYLTSTNMLVSWAFSDLHLSQRRVI